MSRAQGPSSAGWRAAAGLVAALVLLVASAAGAAAAPSTRSGGRLQALLDELVANGASGVVASVDDGRGVRRLASGSARLDPPVPMRPAAQVRVGSITKTFVSTVALQLVGEHRLGLDDTVARWLPGLVPGGAAITVRQLLNHTSGLFNYTDDADFVAAVSAHPRQYRTPRSLVEVATAHAPLFAPGQGWSYSNTNYVVVGLIEERVTGQRVQQLLQDRILEPLHLRDTSFPGGTWRIQGYHAHGYLPPSLTGAGYVDLTDFNGAWAFSAGALVSTTADLQTFMTALLSGRLLRPAPLREMRATVDVSPVLGYGLGLFRLRGPCGTVWGHDGSVPGYLTVAFTDAQGRRSMALSLPTEPDSRTGPLFELAVNTAVCQMFGRVPDAAATNGYARQLSRQPQLLG